MAAIIMWRTSSSLGPDIRHPRHHRRRRRRQPPRRRHQRQVAWRGPRQRRLLRQPPPLRGSARPLPQEPVHGEGGDRLGKPGARGALSLNGCTLGRRFRFVVLFILVFPPPNPAAAADAAAAPTIRVATAPESAWYHRHPRRLPQGKAAITATRDRRRCSRNRCPPAIARVRARGGCRRRLAPCRGRGRRGAFDLRRAGSRLGGIASRVADRAVLDRSQKGGEVPSGAARRHGFFPPVLVSLVSIIACVVRPASGGGGDTDDPRRGRPPRQPQR